MHLSGAPDGTVVRELRSAYLELANAHALKLLARDELVDAHRVLKDADGQASLDESDPMAAVLDSFSQNLA